MYMVISEVVTLAIYAGSIVFLPEYFGKCFSSSSTSRWLTPSADLNFVMTPGFVWKTAVIVSISALPLYIIKLIRSRFAPAASSKLL